MLVTHVPEPSVQLSYLIALLISEPAVNNTRLFFLKKRKNNPVLTTVLQMHSSLSTKVNLTGGNRSGLTGYQSNRSGPVPVSAGIQPSKIQILNLNSKNEKFPKKIPKNTLRCDEYNGVKFSQKFVHLV